MGIFNFFIFVIPPIFALIIHNYLRHGDMSRKRKLVFSFVYLVLINLCTFAISYFRGVKELRFNDMTLSYRFKYIGLGCVCAFVFPFLIFSKDDLFPIKRPSASIIIDLPAPVSPINTFIPS